ncbi:MAG: alpha-glucan family phosphorylase [Kiritimatiellia bacterium]|nr:alpha-glucan family phosphorylase [Kiritimatiellia bacterium]
MPHLQVYNIAPAIPEKLNFLETLAHNLWWSWNTDAIELFRRIDREIWKRSCHNPIVFLSNLSQDQLNTLLADESFLAHIERVRKVYEADVLHRPDTISTVYQPKDCLAYFSAEFGVHESVPLFAGGLGVLAGDYLKAASNMGLPLVAVGLLYRQGYFRQYLNNDGWQQERYPENGLHHLPLERVLDGNRLPLVIQVPADNEQLKAAVWKIQIGRIPLYLLDSSLSENTPALREVTAKLYGGDQQIRLLQEILLGIGGMRALFAIGLEPQVCHMNEGHSAFISIERLAHLINVLRLDKQTAMEIIPRTNIFTTHTPVAAGHDEFPAEMVKPLFASFQTSLGISADDLLNLGRRPGAESNEPFSMTIFALHLSQYNNGVSRLHGTLARRMWRHLWPERDEEEIPITHITNGVHTPSWLSPENILLFERYLGPNWQGKPGDAAFAARIDQIPDEELWRSHEISRARLIRGCRELIIRQMKERNAVAAETDLAKTMLDPHVLTIGFARRFATYKRAALLLHDPQRLEALLTGENQVQIIFAGKAHPHDNEGKGLIRHIIHFARRAGVARRVVFLEDYDINIARILVQGVDVWLNTPRRPLEACGTSGMKAAVNGSLNVSILDGWWCEGSAPDNGWNIGNGEEYQDWGYQDNVESQALYNLLENEIIPRFYTRAHDHFPAAWVKMMKASIKMAFVNFSSHRMAREYEERFYLPALDSWRTLLKDNAAEAGLLAKRRAHLINHWHAVRVEQPVADADLSELRVGNAFTITVAVQLGEINPDDITVELYHGPLSTMNTIAGGHKVAMTLLENHQNGRYLFNCRMECPTTGQYGFIPRVVPRGDLWLQFTPGLIAWADNQK